MRTTIQCCVLLGLLLAGVAPAAEDGGDRPRRLALIVGISAYKEFPDLPTAARDAEAMAEATRARGFDRVELLLNEQATRAGIRAKLDAMRLELRPQDLFALFFAGHGQREESGSGEFAGYLLPYDCRKAHVAEDALPLQDVETAINSMPNDKIVLIIDACHSGILADNVDAAAKDGAFAKRRVRVCTSASAAEWAFEGKEHGLFTQYLLAHPLANQARTGTAEEAERIARDIGAEVRDETGGWQAPRYVEVGAHKLQVTESER